MLQANPIQSVVGELGWKFVLRCILFENAELRFLEESDAEELYALLDANRSHLRQWLPFVDANRSSADSLAFIRMTRKQFADNQGIQLGIFYERKLAGVIGCHLIDWNNRHTSIGYWLGESFQGKGLITSAAGALITHAFTVWKLNRVEIRAAVGNTRSQAIPERLGFVKEGVLRQREWLYDHFVDHISYSMLASDWIQEGQP